MSTQRAIDAAKKWGLYWRSLEYSTRKGKRFSILSPSGKRVHFGLWPFKGHGAFIDHGDEVLRKNWRARHKQTMRQGMLAMNDPESPLFYSWRILW